MHFFIMGKIVQKLIKKHSQVGRDLNFKGNLIPKLYLFGAKCGVQLKKLFNRHAGKLAERNSLR